MLHQPPSAVLHGGTLPASLALPSSLAGFVERAASGHGSVTWIDRERETTVTYAELFARAEEILGGLRDRGLGRGAPVVLMFDDARELLPAIWACILGGIAPAVLRPAAGSGSLHARRVESVRETLGNPLLLTEPPPTHRRDREWTPGERDDAAMFLLTTGTTGPPKLVRLSHANVIAAVAASAHVTACTDADVTMNWLPLHHVGALFRSMRDIYAGARQVQADTAWIAASPLSWIDILDAQQASMTWATNAAYASLVQRRRQIEQRKWDLRRLRSMHSTGEVVVPATMRAVAKLLSPHGLSPAALHAGWGMTEAFSATIASDFLARAASGVADAGHPVPGVSLRVVNDRNEIAACGEIGRLEVRGTLVASYEGANHDAFTSDGWLRTGDLAAIDRGRVVIAGRHDDMIKVGGVPWRSHEIEAVLDAGAAACSVQRHAADAPALAVFVCGSDGDEATVHAVRTRVVAECGITPRFVIPLAALPTGSAGKLDREALRTAFAAGAHDGWLRWPFDLLASRAPAPAAAEVGALARTIAAAFADVLTLRSIDPDENFFAAGGTSLAVAQVVTRLGTSASNRVCTLADLLQAPTANALARRLLLDSTASPAVDDGLARARKRVEQRRNRPTAIRSDP